MLKLCMECFWAFCQFLDEYLRKPYQNAATARHIKIVFPDLEYILGIITPTVESSGDDDAAAFECLNLRLLKRLVVGERFYG